MAYNKIFFQCGPTGSPSGWSAFVNQANGRGIPVYSATSDTQGTLDDLISYGMAHGTTNAGNYIYTGYLTPAEMRQIAPEWQDSWGNYYLSSPIYNHYESREAAEAVYTRNAAYHVSAALSKLPAALQHPFISVGTWNEPRGYTGWGDYEPIPGYTGWADVLGRQAWHIGQELVRRKLAGEPWYRWTAFNFSGGMPNEEAWEAPGMLDYLRLAAMYPEVLRVGLHEYSFDEWIWHEFDSRSLIGRFEKLFGTCDRHGIKRPFVEITEFGWNERSISNDAMTQIKEVAGYYAQFPTVVGAAIWTANGGWGSASRDVPKLAPALYEFTLATTFPDPDQPPTEPTMLKGIDTSLSVVTAARLHSVGAQFWLQRGITWAQRDTNGKRTPNPDPMLGRNLPAAQETGIPFTVYAQVYPDNPEAGGLMLAEIMTELKTKPGLELMTPAVGVENIAGERPLTADIVRRFIDAYVAAAGDLPLPMIYTSRSQWNQIAPTPQPWAGLHPLWVAHYTTAAKPLLPKDWEGWKIWQYADKVIINGMTIDLNRASSENIAALLLEEPPPSTPRVHWVKDWERLVADAAMDAAFSQREPVVFHLEEAQRLGGEVVTWENTKPTGPLDGLTIGRLFNEAYVMTSGFDAPRSYGKHEGYDFDIIGGVADNKAGVLAVMDCQVTAVYRKTGGYGLRVIAESFYNNYHYIWWYGHLDAAYVSKGQFLKRGEAVGEVGSTGNVTGEHVHLTLQIPGHGLSGYVLPDVVDFGSTLPTGTDKPVTAVYDLLPYLRGENKRQYVLQYTWGGGGTHPVQNQWDANGVFYTVKGGGEYEELYHDASFIYRGVDTSEAPDKFYVQTTNGLRGAMWCKRLMRVGERVERRPLVIHYWQRDCQERQRGLVVSGLKLIAHHARYTFDSGIALDNVVELMWDSGEVYFYAKGWGLVGFNFPGGHSYIAEIPTGRPDLKKNKPGCLPLLDGARYYV